MPLLIHFAFVARGRKYRYDLAYPATPRLFFEGNFTRAIIDILKALTYDAGDARRAHAARSVKQFYIFRCQPRTDCGAGERWAWRM